jgi:hypothetical protein
MDKERLTEVLKALLAKTEANGATLDEAKAAFGKAQELADKYGVSLEDVQKADAAEQLRRSEVARGVALHPVDLELAVSIAEFCAVRCWRSRLNGQVSLVFYGFDSDVELANYLRSTLISAFDTEWTVYINFVYEGRGNRANIRASFARGFADKIKERIAFMQRTMTTEAGTALVVAKNAVISKALAHMSFSAGQRRSVTVDAGAYGAGKVSGAAADLGRGVGARRAMIGKS